MPVNRLESLHVNWIKSKKLMKQGEAGEGRGHLPANPLILKNLLTNEHGSSSLHHFIS